MIVFRADLSPQSGLFHLRRCVYLASLLRKGGPALLCSRENRKTAKFLAETNIPFLLIKDPGALELYEAGAVLFDLPDFSSQDRALLAKAKNNGLKTVQIVPAGGDPAPVDLAISGTEYALLHHKFRHFNRVKRKYRRNVKHIFINLGDLLPYRALREIVDTLHRLRFRMKIAPGLSLKKADKRNLMKIYPGVHFCGRSESPARAYFEADLALIASGDEALEAACVGTPALYMPQGAGQEARADVCAALGIGLKIPSLADFAAQTVRDALAPLDQGTRERMGAAGKALVDGLGVQRFLKTLKESGIIA